LSLDNLIDPMSPFIVRHETTRPDEKEPPPVEVPRLRAKSYMEKFINPPDYIDERRRKLQEEREKPKRNPPEPERDVLLFLLQNAPLESWERDVLEIVRDESYYFAPQRQTKILNEGWAAYWHSKLMTQKILDASEIIDYADHNASVLAAAPGQFNPYKVGISLLRYVEERWDKGRFGKDWNECDDYDTRRMWDKGLGLGRKKIFEVRKLYNDLTFIDEFFTEDFCYENQFFSFARNASSGNYEIDAREFKKVKSKLLYQLTNFGEPFIRVEDSNHDNRGELLLRHRHEGVDLHLDHSRATMASLHRVWHRPICLQTVVEGKPRQLRFDGTDHTERTL